MIIEFAYSIIQDENGKRLLSYDTLPSGSNIENKLVKLDIPDIIPEDKEIEYYFDGNNFKYRLNDKPESENMKLRNIIFSLQEKIANIRSGALATPEIDEALESAEGLNKPPQVLPPTGIGETDRSSSPAEKAPDNIEKSSPKEPPTGDLESFDGLMGSESEDGEGDDAPPPGALASMQSTPDFSSLEEM